MPTRSVLLIVFGAFLLLALGGCAAGRASSAAKPQESGSAPQSDLSGENAAGYTHVSAEQAKDIMDAETGYVILDVRTEEEYAKGHIPGALLLPNEAIGTDEISTLPDKDQLILVYCRSGNRSVQASEKLVALGYTRVVEFGGIAQWPYEIEPSA